MADQDTKGAPESPPEGQKKRRLKYGGRQKGQVGRRAKMTAERMMAAVRAGKLLPLDAMLEGLNDAVAIYRTARTKVLDAAGVLLPGAEEHMAEFKDKLQMMIDVARQASPYMHPKLATVDFVTKDETRQTVLRAPELVKTATEWEEQNRRMGLLIDITPQKKVS